MRVLTVLFWPLEPLATKVNHLLSLHLLLGLHKNPLYTKCKYLSIVTGFRVALVYNKKNQNRSVFHDFRLVWQATKRSFAWDSMKANLVFLCLVFKS